MEKIEKEEEKEEKEEKIPDIEVTSPIAARCIDKQQWRKYGTKQGHGFAAEDANAMHDVLCGKKVDKVGVNNSHDGPDRISNGIQIQTKYCADASSSVKSAFRNGTYRYKGMKIEVPCDQYDEAVALMRIKISKGNVPGVSDPNMACELVVRGHYTYDEAVKIAKAGNLESIKFDVKTQAVSCVFACGFSFAVTYLTARSEGLPHDKALKVASERSIRSGLKTLIAGVAVQQLLRTQVGRDFATIVTKNVKHMVRYAMNNELGKKVIVSEASATVGKQVAGKEAVVSATRTQSTQVLTGVGFLVVETIPDAIKYGKGEISGRDFWENAVVNVAGLVGSTAGSNLGRAIGSKVCSGKGNILLGVFDALGGAVGGIVASWGTRKILNSLR